MRVRQVVLVSAFALLAASRPGPCAEPLGLTAVPGVKVGHFTLAEKPTGCTVILTEQGATGGVDVRGGSPGTRETDVLDPRNRVAVVHAVVLAGGSAFGLDAASGAARWLEEHGYGFDAGVAKVPIVPAAILFDLWVAGKPGVRPGADCGYRAAAAASDAQVAEGDVGAGAGATVGKLAGLGRAMKAGVGSAALRLPGGLVVGAIVAVNAAGDVVDPASGRVVAGVRSEDGKGLADARTLVRSGALLAPPARVAPAGTPRASAGAVAPGDDLALVNTTIGVVATNARLTKAQAQKLAQMAHDGVARAISPAHTPFDGDTVFALGTGMLEGASDDRTLSVIGAVAAEVMADAIVRAARESQGLPALGLPAARQLEKPRLP